MCLSFEISTLTFLPQKDDKSYLFGIPETMYTIDVTDGKFISQGKNNN